jgi:hypothetical protein
MDLLPTSMQPKVGHADYAAQRIKKPTAFIVPDVTIWWDAADLRSLP